VSESVEVDLEDSWVAEFAGCSFALSAEKLTDVVHAVVCEARAEDMLDMSRFIH
jgi:hypothetical protein